MVEPADRSSTAGQRLGAPESFGVSTLEPGLRPPAQPPGRQVSIRVQMLDDTQEVFEIPVSNTSSASLSAARINSFIISYYKDPPFLHEQAQQYSSSWGEASLIRQKPKSRLYVAAICYDQADK